MIVIVAYMATYFMPKVSKSDKNIQEISDLEELLQNSSEIHRVWWEGEDSKEWGEVKENCLKKWNIKSDFDESLMRCNPKLIQCVSEFSKNKKLKIENDPVLVGKSNSTIINLDEGGYLFTIKHSKTGRMINFILKNFCHEKYLEPRIYAYGEIPKKISEDFQFDNLEQDIYFDSHLVLNFELEDFLKATNSFSGDYHSEDWFLPAGKVKLETMEKYCNFHGKELMSAEIFDAATFLPNEMENKKPDVVLRSPYFWSKKTKENLDNCNLIFSSECLATNKYKTNFVNPTWAGLFDSMGTYMEAFRNPIEPDNNLKASSFYLPRNSKWHRLGKRSHWSGEGNDLRHFFVNELELNPSIDEIKVGFRCMRRVLK